MRPGRVKTLAILLMFTFDFVVIFVIYFLFFGMLSEYGLKGSTVLLGKLLTILMASGFLLPIWFYEKIKSKVVCKTTRDKKLYDLMYGREKKIFVCFFLILAAFGIFLMK